jgi:hypothetical protein
MRSGQNVHRQDLEPSGEILASTLESPILSVPILSHAPSSVLEPKEEGRTSNIRELAYRLYEERGRLDGRDLEDWLEAEAILQQEGRLVA